MLRLCGNLLTDDVMDNRREQIAVYGTIDVLDLFDDFCEADIL